MSGALRLPSRREAECAPPPPEAAIERAMVAITGEPVPDAHRPFLREELAVGGAPNRLAWGEGGAPPETLAGMRVAVVGGGLSGVLAGVRLARAGVPFAIFERSDEPGGVRRDNACPGWRVDTPIHVHSSSFAPRSDWPAGFSTRDVLRGYVAEVAERLGVAPRIRLGRAVRRGARDEAGGSGGSMSTGRRIRSGSRPRRWCSPRGSSTCRGTPTCRGSRASRGRASTPRDGTIRRTSPARGSP